MVNTFITHKDYKKSAKCLDNKRLLKQCLEAKQILDILTHFAMIVELENYSITDNKFQTSPTFTPKLISEFHGVCKKYLRLKYRYCVINGVCFKAHRPPFRLNKGIKYEISDSKLNVTVFFKNFNPKKSKFFSGVKHPKIKNAYIFKRCDILLENDKYLNLGFCFHPIVAMWLGYENSLIEYINAHLKELSTRTTMKGENYKLPFGFLIVPKKHDSHQKPWWIEKYNSVIFTHKASLTRKYSEHYSKIFGDLGVWKNYGYIWTSKFSKEDIQKSLDNKMWVPQNIKNFAQREVYRKVENTSTKFYIDKQKFLDDVKKIISKCIDGTTS